MRVLLLFICLLAAGTLAGCANATPAPRDQPRPGSAIAQREIEDFIGGALPAGAEQIQAQTQDGMDRLMAISFVAPPAQVDSFIGVLAPGTPLKSGRNPFPSAVAEDVSWWAADSAVEYAGVSFIAANGKSYEVMVDTSAPERWRVYLRVFTL